MRTKLLITLAAALCAVGAASANNGHGIRYSFLGQLTATPSNGGVSITVEGGNKPALRAMLGAPVTQTFAYGSDTEFLKWSKGIPTVVQPGDLAAGDFVWVHVRAPRDSSLADIEKNDAGIVGDHGAQLFKPDQPLYLFRGTLTAVGNGTVTVNVAGGNRRALRLLLGAGSSQTFAYGDDTIFLLWQGKVPTVIDASKLVVGDKIVVRIRAAAKSSLAQVESTPARHIGDREPASKS
jgi:Ca2+-binding RTX toxin-like protein